MVLTQHHAIVLHSGCRFMDPSGAESDSDPTLQEKPDPDPT